MVINIDCMRAVLLVLQRELKISISTDSYPSGDFIHMDFTDLFKHLPQYSKEDIWYVVYNLACCGYIEGIYPEHMNKTRLENLSIYNLTFEGQQFTESIKPETVWNKTKKKIESAGIYTFKFILQTAHDCAVAATETFVSSAMGKR